jgi:phosphocarrier protein FPr
MLAMPDPILTSNLIRLNAIPASKQAAIEEACQLLIAAGCVEPGYAASMVAREAVANTFLGAGVAIPQGLGEDRGLVRKTGIAILQISGGLEWNSGQTARLVVAIAAISDEHILVLRRLTGLIQESDKLEALCVTTDKNDFLTALADAPVAATEAAEDLPEQMTWIVDYPAGLHARPASLWVDAAKRLSAPIRVRHEAEGAEARNLIALLQLGLRDGDDIVISSDDKDALETFYRTVTSLSAGEKADAAKAAAKRDAPIKGWNPPTPGVFLSGIGASPGLAVAPLFLLQAVTPEIADTPTDLTAGAARLNEALAATKQQLHALVDDTTRRLGAAEAGIFRAQSELLSDTDLITLTCQLMVEGHGVAWSWSQAVDRLAAKLAALGNPVLAGRAADLRDAGRRVLGNIDPALKAESLAALPDEKVILVATDLSPSDTAALDLSRIAGLAIAQGGPTAHTAILARTLGLPAVVGAGDELLALPAGTRAIIDGQTGRVYVDPSDETVAAAVAWNETLVVARVAAAAEREKPAVTLDGHQIEIGANINRADQAGLALSEGAESVGLMRTEFLFLESPTVPSEDEQFEIYRTMAEAMGGKKVIIRALDIGGDKQVATLSLPREDNPFLGVRGARLLLRRDDLLVPQLRAIYRAAAEGGAIWIMFPMVTSLAEFLALQARCEEVRTALGAPKIPLGIMIEVPAAALMAEQFAKHVDFFSIGTNDLTQYTLAIDRQNPALAAEADSLHPAVLRLIAQTVAGAAAHGRWVGVCGGIAGDPFGAAVLAGIGVHELSMTPHDIPAVKAKLRGAELVALRALAEKALAAETATEIRALDV